MKKSIALISVLIILLSITFTACSKKNVVIDEDGEKHVLLTDKNGEFVQDEYGVVFEVVTDSRGETETKRFDFPDRVTNKRGNKIENSFVKLHVPSKWTDFSLADKLSMKHKGKACLDMNKTQCQVDVKWNVMLTNEKLYEDYRGPVRWLVESQFNFSDLKEYETEICGLPAKAISYRSAEGGTFYYYLVERGLAAFEIEAYACDECFTEDELKEVISDAYTLKDLGGVRPTAQSTEKSEETSDTSSAE
ncbi:MAG: hypothetical protein IKJ69_02950 [Clostridia bacterium]|nr:hypothetical protein [Clostridia bacterium]